MESNDINLTCEQALELIREIPTRDIVALAWENHCLFEGYRTEVVFNLKTLQMEQRGFLGNSYDINDDHLIVLYTLKGTDFSEGIEDMLSKEEIEALDEDTLENWREYVENLPDYNERMVNYLTFCEEEYNPHREEDWKEQIIAYIDG